MQYRLSTENLKKFHKSGSNTGYKPIDVSRAFGLPPTTWLYKITKGTLTFSELIKICNMYRIPIECFVCTDAKKIELYQVEESKWKPIRTDFSQFLIEARKMEGTVNDTIKVMGTSGRKWYKITYGQTRLEFSMARDIIDWCNALKINLTSYIFDSNSPVAEIPGYTTVVNEQDIYQRYDNLLVEYEIKNKQLEVCKNIIQSMENLVQTYKDSMTAIASDKAVAKATHKVKKIRMRYEIPHEDVVSGKAADEE